MLAAAKKAVTGNTGYNQDPPSLRLWLENYRRDLGPLKRQDEDKDVSSCIEVTVCISLYAFGAFILCCLIKYKSFQKNIKTVQSEIRQENNITGV